MTIHNTEADAKQTARIYGWEIAPYGERFLAAPFATLAKLGLVTDRR